MIIVCRAGYIGSLRGVWVEALRVLTIVGAVAVAANVTDSVAGELARVLPTDLEVIAVVSFFSIVIVALVALLLLGRALERVISQHAAALVNRIIGALLGTTGGILLAGLVMWGLATVPWPYLHASVTQRSSTGPLVIKVTQRTARMTMLDRQATSTAHLFDGDSYAGRR